MYLAVLIDLFSRIVVGWSVSTRNDVVLIVEALKMATASRCPPVGLIYHSDRGGPYASRTYQHHLEQAGMLPSMSAKGDCWDNTVAESFFATVEFELLEGQVAGWPTIANAKSNSTHHHLVTLEQLGRLDLLVTQNIDGLHQQAGHKNVIELRGSLAHVICLNCGRHYTRESIQDRLQDLNPHMPSDIQLAPDGDADLLMDFTIFKNPVCVDCEGILKPDVVFFGGTVAKSIVQSVYDAISVADALLILGTSLNVFSGYRFCKRAAQILKPIAFINPGKTRGDDLFTLKVPGDCVTVLDELMQQI